MLVVYIIKKKKRTGGTYVFHMINFFQEERAGVAAFET